MKSLLFFASSCLVGRFFTGNSWAKVDAALTSTATMLRTNAGLSLNVFIS